MIEITQDYALVRSIIEDPDVMPGYCGDTPPTEGQLRHKEMVYFYDPAVGLFPANVFGRVLVMHAAIPKKNRGIKAVNAAKALAALLHQAGYTVLAQQRNLPHLRAFVKMVGFGYLGMAGELTV